MSRKRKRTGSQITAWTLATLLFVSSLEVSGWGSLTARAEEAAGTTEGTDTTEVADTVEGTDTTEDTDTTESTDTTEDTGTAVVDNAPSELIVWHKDNAATGTYIIRDGRIPNDAWWEDGNYCIQGDNRCYYDSIENTLYLENASTTGITGIQSYGGDLTISLTGDTPLKGDIDFDAGDTEHTLRIEAWDGGSNGGSLTAAGHLGHMESSGAASHITIANNAHVVFSGIDCSGNLTIKNSYIVSNVTGNGDIGRDTGILAGGSIRITDSYVEAKIDSGMSSAIRSSQGEISVSGSQIVAESTMPYEDHVIYGGAYTDSIVTLQWFDYDSNTTVRKTYVYGTAALKEELTIAAGESIDFKNGATLTNPEKLTVEDGGLILVDGVEHTHTVDENMTCTWKDESSHIKAARCNNCPIDYTPGEVTEEHAFDAQGFCTECGAYEAPEHTEDNVYRIANAGQLYWFAGYVNQTIPYIEQYWNSVASNAVLTADITVNENVLRDDGSLNEDKMQTFRRWTPIGGGYSYQGRFDGNGHTVSGLYCDYSDADENGFFAANSGEGTIANVGVLDSWFYSDYSGDSTLSMGSICGFNRGLLLNCYSDSTIKQNGNGDVGGLCGFNSCGTIINSYYAGVIDSASGYHGGICGRNLTTDSLIANCYFDQTRYKGEAFGESTDTYEKVAGKDNGAFVGGEVAFLLAQEDTYTKTTDGVESQVTYDGSIWGQKLGTDSYPVLGGDKVYPVTGYEGCQGKPGEAGIAGYSNTEGEVSYGAHTDADDDGRCDDCDALIDGIGAKLAGYTVSLNGNIGVNFYMELSEEIVKDKDAYMQFTLPNGTVTKVPVSEAAIDTEVREGTIYYKFPCEVASYEMTQEIKAQMFDGKGNSGREYTYTVRDYAEYLLENETLYMEYIPFVVAMLDYGACSQKYFNVAVEDLANKESNPKNDISEPYEDYLEEFAGRKAENETLGSFAGISLVLKSATKLNVFYEPGKDVDVSKLTFWVDGKEIQPVKRGQYYILSLPEIRANELEGTKTFTVTDGNNTLTGEYCAMMYCYQVLNAGEGTYPENLVTLVKAFSMYAYKAHSIAK